MKTECPYCERLIRGSAAGAQMKSHLQTHFGTHPAAGNSFASNTKGQRKARRGIRLHPKETAARL